MKIKLDVKEGAQGAKAEYKYGVLNLTLPNPSLSARQSPRQNHLLAALPAADYERLLPHLELVPLPLAWPVYEAGDAQGYVLFPTTSIVSLLCVMQNGSSAQIALVGNESASVMPW